MNHLDKFESEMRGIIWVVIIFTTLLLGPASCVDPAYPAEPRPTWEYHLITWMPPHAERYTNTFYFDKESRCRTFLKHIKLVLADSRNTHPGFKWVGICAPIQRA